MQFRSSERWTERGCDVCASTILARGRLNLGSLLAAARLGRPHGAEVHFHTKKVLSADECAIAMLAWQPIGVPDPATNDYRLFGQPYFTGTGISPSDTGTIPPGPALAHVRNFSST